MVTKKTRLVSGFAAVLMLLSMLTVFVVPAVAEANSWSAHETVQENGLENKSSLPDITAYTAGTTAYSVSSRAGMEKILSLVAGGNTLEGVTIYQTADIDMGALPFVGIGAAGTNNTTNVSFAFSGTFDGNGFTFDNLYVLRNGTVASVTDELLNGGALFARTEGAVLKNIGIASGLVVGGERTAAIVGNAVNTSVINCWNAATVVGGYTQGVGGIVGRASGNSTKVINCYNLGLIFNREKNATGIVGYMEPGYPDAMIQNCYNAGEIVTGMNGYGTAAASAQLEGYSIIMGADYTAETALENANNYYIKNRGKIRSVAELIVRNDGVLSDAAQSTISSTDVAAGLEESALTDNSEAGLAALLNAGTVGAGAVDGYDLYFENSGAGYPVLAYAQNGAVKVKRVAHSAINVNGNTWKNGSALFASISAARDGGWAAASSSKLSNLEIGTANDLFVLGLVSSYGPFKSTFGNGNITLTADIDMDKMDLCPVEYYVPIASGTTGATTNASFDGTFNGANHVIYNWKYYAPMVLAAPCGGLISKVNTATVKNLGMINAHGTYESKISGGYTYAALMVEREYGKVTIDNCFVTGTLNVVSGVNANNYGGIFSTTWNGNNPSINNCWADIDVTGVSTGKARAIGKINVITNTSTNNYYIADVEPAISKGTDKVDNGSYMNQTQLPTTYSVADGTLAAYLNSKMSQKFLCKNGVTTFAQSASEATYMLTTIKKVGNYVIDEDVYVYNANETVTTPVYEGYELDTTSQGFFYPAANGTFAMPAQSVTLYYQQAVPDYSLVEDFITEYSRYDLDLLADDSVIEKLLRDAEDILARKDIMSAAEGLTAVRNLLERGDAIVLELKDVYPYLPNYADKELYEAFKTNKEWAVSSREDWVAIVEDSVVNDYYGYTFHFLNDVDMKDDPVAPIRPSTDAAFKGKIDGHGHVMENLSINWDMANGACVALVGYANSGATIQNLGIASGSIRAYGTNSNEAMVASFIGQGDDVIIRNCWNAASVDSSAGNNSGGQSTSGIARVRNNSVIDGCYNLGVVKGKGYTGSLSGYTQTYTKVYNSFATSTPVGGTTTFLRYTPGSDLVGLTLNTYMVGGNYTFDAGNSKVNVDHLKLGAEAYSSGELAWTLNQNYVETEYERTYFTLKDGKTVYGTEENQVRRISLVDGSETTYVYAPANTQYTITAFLGATYAIANGYAGSLNGNVLSVPNEDTVINVTKSTLDFSALQAALEKYDDGIYPYLVNGAETKVLVEAAYSKIKNGTYTDQAEVNADAEALNAAYVYAGYPALPSVTDAAKYPEMEGYMISNLADLEFVGKNETLFAADKVLYLGADITIPSAGSAANDLSGLVASIDGQGHTITGVTLNGGSWLGDYTGNFIRNLTMDSWNFTGMPWQGGMLIRYNYSTDLRIENVKAYKCSVTTGGNNGLSLFIGIQKGTEYKATFKNITIEECSMDRKTNSGNSGFLFGRLITGELVAENIVLNNNTLKGARHGGGAGILLGEISSTATVKNVVVANTKNEDDGSTHTLIGNLKRTDDGYSATNPNQTSVALIADNIIAFNNDTGNYDALIYEGASNHQGANAKLTASVTNVYTDQSLVLDGTALLADITTGAATPAAKFTNGTVVWDLNNAGVAQKWEISESGCPVPDTDGIGQPVQVSLDCQKGLYKLYTNCKGNVIGLTDEIFNAAEWNGYATKEALEAAVFTENTVITEIPCEHEWSYSYNNDGTHTKTCIAADGCGSTEVVVCSKVYAVGENNTHTVSCEFCGHTESESCKITSKVVAPTCDEAQSLVTGCFICGRVNTKVYNEAIPALGHEWTCVHDEGTEGATATHTRTCSVCEVVESGVACTFKDTYTEHTKEAKGYTTYTCECNYSYNEEDADFAHIWSENGTITKYPTYVQDGMTEEECEGTMKTTCTICGETGEVTVAALTGAGIKVNAPATAEQGDTIQVVLELVNNTGVAGFTAGVTYDAAALTLIGITDNGLFDTVQGPDDLTAANGYCKLTVVNVGNVTANGAFVTLTFTVNSDAEDGLYDITVETVKSPGDIEGDTGASDANGNYVAVGGSGAVVNVDGFIWGDVNDDTVCDIDDALLVLRYLAGLLGLDDMAKPESGNTDGADGIMIDDALLILRYLAGLYTPPQD